MSAPAVVDFKQPSEFAFSKENLKKVDAILAKYPDGRQQSAVMPLLDLAQRQHDGWLSRAAMDAVATMLDMPFIRVYEVASFYTMYNLAPVGKHVVEVCTTTPCWLRGSDGLVTACKNKLGVNMGENTPDGMFTLRHVECQGACVNAPMVKIDDDFYEDLEPADMETILDALANGEQPKTGSYKGRKSSEPEGGATTLKVIEGGKDA